VARVTDSVDIDQYSRKIDFLIILDYYRLSTKNTKAMLYGGKTVVHIAHVPMYVFHSAMTADMRIKPCQHFFFQLVIMLLNLGKGDSSFLSDLMN